MPSSRSRIQSESDAGPSVQSTRSRSTPSGPAPARRRVAPPVDAHRLVAPLPAVAVRAVVHAPSVELGSSPSMSGNSSTTPVASSSFRVRSRVPSSHRTSKPRWSRVASTTPRRSISTVSYASRSSRADRRKSAPAGMPSRVRKPCTACDHRLRGSPTSHTSTRRRQRPSISAALSPAGPASDDDAVVRHVGVRTPRPPLP